MSQNFIKTVKTAFYDNQSKRKFDIKLKLPGKIKIKCRKKNLINIHKKTKKISNI